MKKVMALCLAVAMCFSLAACKSKEAKKVDKLILAIGEVSLESGNAIEDAEKAYGLLTDEQKAEVESYSLLETAAEEYDQLLQVKRVCGLIDELGEVSLENEDTLLRAKEAYESLSTELQGQVDNYGLLKDAMVRYAEILIQSIGEITVQSGDVIDKASEFYDSLPAECQARVINGEALKEAVETHTSLVEWIQKVSVGLPELSKWSSRMGDAYQKLIFIAKNIGNTNSKGSVAVASSYMDGMANDFADIDIDLIKTASPEIGADAEKIIAKYYLIISDLREMSRLDSAAYVPGIRSAAIETMYMIEDISSKQAEFAESIQQYISEEP